MSDPSSMSEPLSPELQRQAEEARLGRYVGSLTPPRAQSLRTLTIGAGVGLVTTLAWVGIRERTWLVAVVLLLGAATALGSIVIAVVELMPGPGRLLLFEHGFLHVVPGGDIAASEYGATPEGAQLQARARAHGRHGPVQR